MRRSFKVLNRCSRHPAEKPSPRRPVPILALDKGRQSKLSPFILTFPDADLDLVFEPPLEVVVQELADVLHSRNLQVGVPVMMVVLRQDSSDALLEFREIEYHGALVFALYGDIDAVCMPMGRPTFLMIGQMMCAIDILSYSQLHRCYQKSDGVKCLSLFRSGTAPLGQSSSSCNSA